MRQPPSSSRTWEATASNSVLANSFVSSSAARAMFAGLTDSTASDAAWASFARFAARSARMSSTERLEPLDMRFSSTDCPPAYRPPGPGAQAL